MLRSQTIVGDRNFFQFKTDALTFQIIGTHEGVYKRAMEIFMHREQTLFYKQASIEQAKRALYEVEDKFMEFMREFRAGMINIEDAVKHAKKWTDEAGWAHTYCGQYTHPVAAEGLVLNYTKFLTTKYKCARCTIKLEEENQACG